MTPQSPGAGTIRPPWHRRGFVPGWITLASAVLFTAAGAFAEQVGSPACRLEDGCGPEPIRTLSFGLLAAVIVAAFLHTKAVRLVAAAFLVAFTVARLVEVGQQWWVDASAAGFVVLVSYVTWPRHTAVQGLADRPATAHERVPVEPTHTLVRPGWLIGCAVSVVLAAAGVAGFVISQPPEAAADWLLVSGIAGGLAVTFGWRAVDSTITRRRFLRRKQPVRQCSVLPLRFEMIVIPEHGDTVLVIPSSVWEEARLERLWANAQPDGCPATVYGAAAAGRWLAVAIDGQVILGRAPAWVEAREASLREAVTLIRHLADAVPNTDVADAIRRSADRYAAEVGEPDNTLPGT